MAPQILSPQVFTLPQEDYSGIGQATGLLVRALLDSYRRKGPQVYTSPTGTNTVLSPAERVAASPNLQLADLVRDQVVPNTPGTILAPMRLPFLESPPVDLTLQAKQAELARTRAATKESETDTLLKQKVLKGELKTVQLPDGRQVYISESVTGPKVTQIPPSRPDRISKLIDQELSTETPPTVLPTNLPDPSELAEGTKATNKKTGEQFVVRGGAWQRL